MYQLTAHLCRKIYTKADFINHNNNIKTLGGVDPAVGVVLHVLHLAVHPLAGPGACFIHSPAYSAGSWQGLVKDIYSLHLVVPLYLLAGPLGELLGHVFVVVGLCPGVWFLG